METMRLQGTMSINKAGHLAIGGCDTMDLAQEFGTPLMVIDEAHLREQCRAFKKAFAGGQVIYAGKAMLLQAICRIVAEEGLSLDVVSGGELHTALAAGFPPERIFFHGNNKSREELEQAIAAGVGRIVVDNFNELELLADLGANVEREIPVMLRLTPGIEAHTHEYIKTGQTDSKFGFSISDGSAESAVLSVAGLSSLQLVGLHCHIGSQIFSAEPYAEAAAIMMDFLNSISSRNGTAGTSIEELDLGGGFGIYYAVGDDPLPPSEFAEAIKAVMSEKIRTKPGPKVLVEPGRAIVGPAGTTLYTVGAIKDIPGVRRYVSVDGGMADNIRPALYQARYEAILANKADQPVTEKVTIAGKCCESGDMLVWEAWLAGTVPGDLLAISCTGAYCYPMASNYNRLPRPAVVLVNEGSAELICRRETPADLVRLEVLPPRLSRRHSGPEETV